MRAAWIVCGKDLRQRLRDRTALLVGLAMPLLLAGLFTLFPDTEGFQLQRWMAGGLDLTAVLVCYLLGREIEGRRFGLLLAAVAAVAKPQIRESLYGCHEITASLATALCLWSTFWILRRPGPIPFLAWGLSLSLAVYSYMGCLPLVLFLILAVLGLGNVYFQLHSLPERRAHRANRFQMEIVAVLALIALFTHQHIFWIAALLLALVQFPDFSTPIQSISRSLEKLASRVRGGPPPAAEASGQVSAEEPDPPPVEDSASPGVESAAATRPHQEQALERT